MSLKFCLIYNLKNTNVLEQNIKETLSHRRALRLAREAADETGTLMGGNISNTGIYDPENPESIEKAKLINKVCVSFTSLKYKCNVKWLLQ